MPRLHTRVGTYAALILLAVMAALCVRLGFWQLSRAQERETLAAEIAEGQRLAPLQLTPATPAAALTPWRPAHARGHWRHELTVLLDNRNQNGRPGYWVATPLQLEAPGASPAGAGAVENSPSALLVLRGWLPRPPAGDPLEIPRPTGPQELDGELLARVPRLFELWSWARTGVATGLTARLPAPDARPPIVQNLPLDDYAAATGLQFLPTVLAQTGAAQDRDPLLRDWPAPSLDADKNRGYALQWFGFSAIALIALLILALRTLRRAAA